MSEAEPGRAGDTETKGTAILIGLTIQYIVTYIMVPGKSFLGRPLKMPRLHPHNGAN